MYGKINENYLDSIDIDSFDTIPLDSVEYNESSDEAIVITPDDGYMLTNIKINGIHL